jgi:hypothetical protein
MAEDVGPTRTNAVRRLYERINNRSELNEDDRNDMRKNAVNKYGREVVERVEQGGTRITKAEAHVAHEGFERRRETQEESRPIGSSGVWSRLKSIVNPPLEERQRNWDRRSKIRGIQIKQERQEAELDRIRLHRARLQSQTSKVRRESHESRGQDPLASMFSGGGGGAGGESNRSQEKFEDPMAAMFKSQGKKPPRFM